jgi:hypothetical protein
MIGIIAGEAPAQGVGALGFAVLPGPERRDVLEGERARRGGRLPLDLRLGQAAGERGAALEIARGGVGAERAPGALEPRSRA